MAIFKFGTVEFNTQRLLSRAVLQVERGDRLSGQSAECTAALDLVHDLLVRISKILLIQTLKGSDAEL